MKRVRHWPQPVPAIERAWKRIIRDPDTECWEWTGAKQWTGYGRIVITPEDGPPRWTGAHRVVFEALVAPIPNGYQIDHLCRNTSCVNPAHLEVVTPRENQRRGNSPAGRNARKTHCVHGHAFTPDNTLTNRDGSRRCRTCNILYFRARRRRIREATEGGSA